MATFQAQVEALTSLSIGTTPTTAELTEFLTQGAKDVINRTVAANPETKMEFTASSEDTNNSGVTINGDIVDVVREHDSTSILRPCTKINPNDRYEVTDTESLSYRSKYNPGWYELNGKVHTAPISAGSNNSSFVTQITYPAVAYGDTGWSYPNKYETLIAYYGAMMSLMANAGALHSDSDLATALALINTSLDSSVTRLAAAVTPLTAADARIATAKAEIDLANAEADEMASYTDNSSDFAAVLVSANNILSSVTALIDLANDEFDEVATQVGGSKDSPITDAFTQFELAVGEAVQAEAEADDSAIPTALAAIKTQLDASLVAIAIGATEAAEIATHTDASSSTFLSSLASINTELDKCDEICTEANTEFDKVDAILDKGEVDSEAAVNTAAAKIITELDETQTVCDLINTNVDSSVTALGNAATEIALANAEADDIPAINVEAAGWLALGKAELAEAVTLVDNGIDTATAAITTASGRINTAVALANAEFDKCDSLLTAGETDTEADVNTALASTVVELGKTKSQCDQIEHEIEYARTEILKAITEADELVAITDSSGTFSTSLTSMVAAANKFTTGDDPGIWGHETLFTTNSGITDAKDALLKVQKIIDDGANIGGDNASATATSAQYWLSEEDNEMVEATLQIANTEIKRAQTAISEFTALAQVLESEVTSFGKDIKARTEWVGAKGQAITSHLDTGKAYIDTANAFSKEVQTRLAISDGYNKEVQIRLAQAQSKRDSSQSRIAFGNAYLTEAKAGADEAQSYVGEVNARIAQVRAQVEVTKGYIDGSQGYQGVIGTYVKNVETYLGTADGYLKQSKGFIDAANGFFTEIKAKTAIAEGYGKEIEVRLRQAQAKREEAKSRIESGNSYLQEAQTRLAQANGYAKEAEGHGGFVEAKSKAVQTTISNATGYIQAAQGYGNIVKSYADSVNIFKTTSETRIAAGNSYLQEGKAIIEVGNSYISEAQGRIAQAQGYMSQAQGRGTFAGAKSQTVQAYISTAKTYLEEAQKDLESSKGQAIVSKGYIDTAQGAANEVTSRMQYLQQEYNWYMNIYNEIKNKYDEAFLTEEQITKRKQAMQENLRENAKRRR